MDPYLAQSFIKFAFLIFVLSRLTHSNFGLFCFLLVGSHEAALLL